MSQDMDQEQEPSDSVHLINFFAAPDRPVAGGTVFVRPDRELAASQDNVSDTPADR
jgi:hypothetical protein